ncbi:hypothetical protein N5923_18235 [Erwiniaceae bacterium BAC15a-03b]|uniref:Uncharacterized protein n=1 Tax=Winslowiella arboricola TaxID=2978220 RepID=A0A9J6PM78_9GAMM|nr:hypothetical protein [Winslowiella arboricola]MCU5775724.1 hypothetical protein [Winslowiella arboricola]MCU5779425.1 hypothetical protein [Winslowiella arboricola]
MSQTELNLLLEERSSRHQLLPHQQPPFMQAASTAIVANVERDEWFFGDPAAADSDESSSDISGIRTIAGPGGVTSQSGRKRTADIRDDPTQYYQHFRWRHPQPAAATSLLPPDNNASSEQVATTPSGSATHALQAGYPELMLKDRFLHWVRKFKEYYIGNSALDCCISLFNQPGMPRGASCALMQEVIRKVLEIEGISSSPNSSTIRIAVMATREVNYLPETARVLEQLREMAPGYQGYNLESLIVALLNKLATKKPVAGCVLFSILYDFYRRYNAGLKGYEFINTLLKGKAPSIDTVRFAVKVQGITVSQTLLDWLRPHLLTAPDYNPIKLTGDKIKAIFAHKDAPGDLNERTFYEAQRQILKGNALGSRFVFNILVPDAQHKRPPPLSKTELRKQAEAGIGLHPQAEALIEQANWSTLPGTNEKKLISLLLFLQEHSVKLESKQLYIALWSELGNQTPSYNSIAKIHSRFNAKVPEQVFKWVKHNLTSLQGFEAKEIARKLFEREPKPHGVSASSIYKALLKLLRDKEPGFSLDRMPGIDYVYQLDKDYQPARARTAAADVFRRLPSPASGKDPLNNP